MAPPLEISIPTTSLHTPADNPSKPYTLYNITLRLPLRSFVVQKRYSDFSALHQALTTHVGTPPPSPLPAKTWFRSTVSSPELTENRRVALERYLRAVAEPPDRRWRDAPAWRAFLNLPSASGASVSGVSVDGRVPAIGLRDAMLAAASDPATWVDLNTEMKREMNAARAALERKERAVENGEQLEAEAQARKALVKVGSLLGPLEEGLGVMKESGRMHAGEINRRRGLVAAAKEEKGALDQWASRVARKGAGRGRDGDTATDSERAKLLPPQRPAGRRLGPLPETEETRERDNGGMLQLNADKMRQQDNEVALLGELVRKQKEIAIKVNEELEAQAPMVDHMHSLVDTQHRKLGVANRRAKNLDR